MLCDVKLLSRAKLCENFEKCEFQFRFENGENFRARYVVRLAPLYMVAMSSKDERAFDIAAHMALRWGTDGDIVLIRDMKKLLGK